MRDDPNSISGGISYFSGRYGWACDNVRNYEVVLADGSIVNASPVSNPDLYWALRGGSGTNFGIVSRFDLATFEQGLMWGGGRYYSMSTNTSLAEAFANFNEAAPTDPYAHLYIAFVYTQGSYIGVSGPAYGKPIADPPIFNELASIPHLMDATSIADMSTLSIELNQTTYLRETFRTITFKNSAPLIKKIIEIFIEEVNPILNIPGLIPAFAFQPISLNIIQKMSSNGGNVFGLSPDDGPLTLMNLNFGWSNAEDDDAVYKATSNFLARSVALAKSMDLHHRFIYMNYATLDQDVFAGYGYENHERLKRVREKYDPEGVFKNLQPGYFKL
jgi:FAD/FMN-containing dehydrogenase